MTKFLSNDSKALLNIKGGKGAISKINYYYYSEATLGDKVAQLVRCRTSNQRVAGSIPGQGTLV